MKRDVIIKKSNVALKRLTELYDNPMFESIKMIGHKTTNRVKITIEQNYFKYQFILLFMNERPVVVKQCTNPTYTGWHPVMFRDEELELFDKLGFNLEYQNDQDIGSWFE